MRSDYYRMVSEVAARNGCFPFMNLSDEEARQLNAAQLADQPLAGGAVFQHLDVVFPPSPHDDEIDIRRRHPEPAIFTLYEQPTFVPGYNISLADWNVEFMYPNWVIGCTHPPPPPRQQEPPPSCDWAFDDKDPDFDDYDYADDVVNFARDDNDMARASATKGPGAAKFRKPKSEKKD